MAKAIAIALNRDHALVSAIHYILDFMYGTPQRARATFRFAVVLAILGCAMNMANSNAYSVCSQDTLAH